MDLVERSPADFDVLFASQYPTVVRTLRYVVGDRAVAEEIAQDAFVQLFRHWAKVSRYDRPDLWVRTVALRAAVRERRRGWRRTAEEAGQARSRPEPEPPDLDRRLDVLSALTRLTARQRAVVALFYFEDRPMEEIASVLECSESSAWSHLSAARRRLSTLLAPEVTDVDRP